MTTGATTGATTVDTTVVGAAVATAGVAVDMEAEAEDMEEVEEATLVDQWGQEFIAETFQWILRSAKSKTCSTSTVALLTSM